MQDLSQDPDYAQAKNSFRCEPKSEEQSISDDQFLGSKADDLSMVLTLYLDELSQWKNCLMFNGNYTIQSQIKTVQEKYESILLKKKKKFLIIDFNRLDNQEFQRLKALLQIHENYIREVFGLKTEVRRYIYLLELVGFLFTVFVALKRRMKKIPNMNRLLPVIFGLLIILLINSIFFLFV